MQAIVQSRSWRALIATVLAIALAMAVGSTPSADAGLSTSTVYVATGENFPDALGAAAAAGAVGAPVLLVAQNSVPGPTLNELNRLQPETIYIVGGTGVVSDAVKTVLEGLAFNPTVERIAGADRYSTAAALSEASFPAVSPGAARVTLDFAQTSVSPDTADTVNVQVPGPGALIVQVHGQLWINFDATTDESVHTAVSLAICDGPNTFATSSCDDSLTNVNYVDPDDTSNSNATPGVSTTRVVNVTEAGLRTFYINTIQNSGSYTLNDWYTYALVTFLPGHNSLDGAVDSDPVVISLPTQQGD